MPLPAMPGLSGGLTACPADRLAAAARLLRNFGFGGLICCVPVRIPAGAAVVAAIACRLPHFVSCAWREYIAGGLLAGYCFFIPPLGDGVIPGVIAFVGASRAFDDRRARNVLVERSPSAVKVAIGDDLKIFGVRV